VDDSDDATEGAIISVVNVGLNKWLIIGNGDEGLLTSRSERRTPPYRGIRWTPPDGGTRT